MTKKTLIIMADSRSLKAGRSGYRYHHYAAAINKIYAGAHGYDFIWFSPKSSAFRYLFSFFRYSLRRLAGKARKDNSPAKLVSSCTNVRHNQERAAPWFKLIAFSHAIKLPYERIVYVDSDCVFKDHRRSIDDYLDTVEPINGSIEPKSAMISFLKNYPWDGCLPCSGFFVAEKSCSLSVFVGEWWDLDNSKYNYKHDYEQNSLHRIFSKYNNKICILDDLFFVEKKGQFLRHVHSGEGQLRLGYFCELFARISAQPDGLSEVLNSVEVKVLTGEM